MVDVTTPYPREKIVSTYSAFGGVLGGFILYIIMILSTKYMNFSYDSITVLGYVLPKYISVIVVQLHMMGMFICMGGIVGFIPALLTAWIIVASKIYATAKSFILVFVIGMMVSALFLAFLRASFWTIAVTGGTSAVILAFFSLPKKPLENDASD